MPHWRALALVLLCALGLAACHPAVVPFQGVDIQGAGYGQKWALQDQDGQPRTLADYRGKVLLFYFGFTQCPDICPVTLGHLKSTMGLLGAEATQVRTLFVTVDPDADTAPVLKAYLAGFGPGFVGLTGSPAALDAAAKDFRVYAKRKGEAANAGFEHAGFVYVLDRKGAPRLLYGPEATPAAMAADLKRLLAE